MDSFVFWIRLIGVTILALLFAADTSRSLRSGRATLYTFKPARRGEQSKAYWSMVATQAALAALCTAAAVYTLARL